MCVCVCVCVCLCTPLSIEFFLCIHVYQINCFFTSPNQLLFYFLCISLSFSLSLSISQNIYIYIYIYIYIIIMSCLQHGYPWPSLATSPYYSSPPAGLQGYIVCPHIVAGRPAFARPYVAVHRSTSLMSSSLLLQLCPACLVRLTCIVFVMGGKCPYSWCLLGCCRQDCSILLSTFLCNFRLVSSPAA